MQRLLHRRRDKRRLKLWLGLFFLALAIPAGFLIHHAYSQLKWEAFHRHRLMAEEFAARVDRQLVELIESEEAHSFADYGFLVVSGEPAASFLQRSALSAHPPDSPVPGLVGYFQIDANGVFSTPLVPPPGVSPSDVGLSDRELALRRAAERRILGILDENRLVRKKVEQTRRPLSQIPASPAAVQDEIGGARERDDDQTLAESVPAEVEAIAEQTAFDRLNQPRAGASLKQKTATLGRVEDLKLDAEFETRSDALRSDPAASKQADRRDVRASRKEQSAVYEQGAAVLDGAASKAARDVRISIFESQIDAFEFALLDGGYFVLFRKVWRDAQRYIQGALIEPKPFFDGVAGAEFQGTALSLASNLAVAYAGDVLSAYGGQISRQYLASIDELTGTLLYKTNLSAPLGDAQLIFSITRLPAGPGARIVLWLAFALALVLSVGLILMYRLGAAHIDVANQQQDFVSAVSHELRTPLTSIRMYGEILREGWADEEKRKVYYNYIHDESERLSRLISNVLQLARMTRNDLQLELKPVTVAELLDGVRSKVASQIESAGFKLNMHPSIQAGKDSRDRIEASHPRPETGCRAAAMREAGRAVINVDADAFTQIMINLVDNAIKFSANAERKVVDISCDLRPDGAARFRVRDYGPGVPKPQIKKIFKLFYRSGDELTRDTVGTGIGLALVHQLVRAMNGRVDAVNRAPGAEFIVEFSASGG